MTRRRARRALDRIVDAASIEGLLASPSAERADVYAMLLELQSPSSPWRRVVARVARRRGFTPAYVVDRGTALLGTLDERKRHDLYALFGVPPDATADDLRRRWHVLAKRHHPDHGPTDARLFRRFQAAYAVLSDPVQRMRWEDAWRRQQGPVVASISAATARRRRRRRPALRRVGGPGVRRLLRGAAIAAAVWAAIRLWPSPPVRRTAEPPATAKAPSAPLAGTSVPDDDAVSVPDVSITSAPAPAEASAPVALGSAPPAAEPASVAPEAASLPPAPAPAAVASDGPEPDLAKGAVRIVDEAQEPLAMLEPLIAAPDAAPPEPEPPAPAVAAEPAPEGVVAAVVRDPMAPAAAAVAVAEPLMEPVEPLATLDPVPAEGVPMQPEATVIARPAAAPTTVLTVESRTVTPAHSRRAEPHVVATTRGSAVHVVSPTVTPASAPVRVAHSSPTAPPPAPPVLHLAAALALPGTPTSSPPTGTVPGAAAHAHHAARLARAPRATKDAGRAHAAATSKTAAPSKTATTSTPPSRTAAARPSTAAPSAQAHPRAHASRAPTSPPARVVAAAPHAAPRTAAPARRTAAAQMPTLMALTAPEPIDLTSARGFVEEFARRYSAHRAMALLELFTSGAVVDGRQGIAIADGFDVTFRRLGDVRLRPLDVELEPMTTGAAVRADYELTVPGRAPVHGRAVWTLVRQSGAIRAAELRSSTLAER
jgi:hypothetical protein